MIIRIKQKIFKTRRVRVIRCEFCAEGGSEGRLTSQILQSLYGVILSIT